MNRTIQPVVYVVLAWLMAATLAGCALVPPREIPAQTGRVLDEETRLPIEGAIVVFRWQGTGIKAFVDTQTVCYHVESAVTDAEGRYVTAPWKEESRYRDLSMKQILAMVYKPGYRHVRTDRETSDQYLRKDSRNAKARLRYLFHAAVDCDEAGDERKRFLPLYKSMYGEANALAIDEEDHKTVEMMYFQLESLEVGSVKALDRMIERRRERE